MTTALAHPEPEVAVTPSHISPTAARNYLGCSLRFYFERVLELPSPTSVSLHLGKAIHRALQVFHLARWRGQDDSVEAVANAFEESFVALERDEGPVDYKDAAAREKARQAGLRVVAAYLDSPEALSEPPRAVEVLLTERIDGLSVPLTGAMDLVRQDLSSVDFKSSASRPDPEQAAFENELQLVSYQLLLEQASGDTPPRLDLVFLVKTKTPQVVKVSVRPADRQRKARVVALLETAVQGIAGGRFHPQPGMHCSWCSFRAQCAAWTPERVVEGEGGMNSPILSRLLLVLVAAGLASCKKDPPEPVVDLTPLGDAVRFLAVALVLGAIISAIIQHMGRQ